LYAAACDAMMAARPEYGRFGGQAVLLNDWTQLDVASYEPVGMAVVHELTDDEEIVHVFGEVDLSNVRELERAVQHAATGERMIVVDLSKCQYIDSSVLTALLRAHKIFGARLQIVTAKRGNVARLFRITKMDTVLSVTTMRTPPGPTAAA
jgi:anti-anti-sigma factor